MVRRIFITLAVMVVIGVVLVFGKAPVLADCPTCVPPCDMGGGFTLTPVLGPDGEFPVKEGNLFKWAYQINSTVNNSQLAVLVPFCCPAVVYSITGGGQPYLAGEGDPTTGFGAGNYQARVMRLALSGSVYSFYSDQPLPTGPVSIQLKAGKNLYYAQNILGPVCATCNTGGAFQPELTEQLFYIENVLFDVVFDVNTCNAVTVQASTDNGTTWTVLTPGAPPTINGEPITDCGPLEGNRKCTRCVIHTGNSCTRYNIGGQWYSYPRPPC